MSMKKMTPSQLLFLSLLLPCFTSLAFGQNTTDPAEGTIFLYINIVWKIMKKPFADNSPLKFGYEQWKL